VIKYSPEIDGDGHTSCWDSIVLYIKDYSEPIPSQMVSSFFNHFKDEWPYMDEVAFGNIPVNCGFTPIEIKDIINDNKPVYFIGFYDLSESKLKYFDYFFNEIESDNCK